MKIILDVRERGIIELIERDATFPFSVEKQQLDIGDILIKDDDDNLKLIIERKTISDLASSIKDGRYSEQSMRLSSHPHHNHHIIYMIEGNPYQHREKNIILSALFSISYFKGFTVWFSSSIANTVFWIQRFAEKISKEHGKKDGHYMLLSQPGNDDPTGNTQQIEYMNCIKMSKKENVTPDNINCLMLSQIPSVSITTASIIMNECTTIYNLQNKLIEDPHYLDNLKYTTSTGKERKISSLAIKNILHYLAIPL